MVVSDRRGQSLAELLIGIALGAIFLVGAASVIAPSLKTTSQVAQTQSESELANELVGNLKSWTGTNWNAMMNLATGSGNPYYLNTTSSPFSAATGTESVSVGSSTYIRYFYTSDVYRDASANVTTTISGNYYDPATKLFTVSLRPSGSATSSAVAFPLYLTRNGSNLFSQTSWAGGGGNNNATAFVSNAYSNATSVTISAGGAIQLTTSGGGSCVY